MAKDDGSFEGVDAPAGSQGQGDDVADAMAAIALLDGGPGDTLGTTTESEGSTDETPAGATSGAKEADGVTVEPSGVLAADGKNIIPYDVLKSTREAQATAEAQRAQADETARAATAEAEALRAELETLKKGGTTEEVTTATSDRITNLKAKADAIRDDLPAMAELLDGVIEELEDVAGVRKTLEERDAAAKATREQAQKTVEQQQAEAVRAAIDSNPTLAYWEAQKDPAALAAYDRACDEDELLRKDPAWGAKTYDDRFAEAVRRTQLVMPDAPKPPVAPNAAEIAARARKAVRDAGDFEPNSLTDLPAGAPPGSDPLENLANVDVAVLGNRARDMTDAQIEQLLARVG